jgi:cytidine deaminase
MKIHEAAAGYIDRAQIAGGDAGRLRSELGIEQEALLLGLVGVAANLARAPISNFKVGAVAEGTSGSLYLGANIEIMRGTLALSIHAEQAAIINAHAHGEGGVKRLAITAEPCGYCRQFLKELTTAEELTILTGTRSLALNDLLPNAFGPADLGVDARLLSSQDHGMSFAASGGEISEARQSALAAANRSYAPYTRAYGGAAITTKAGEIFAGSYLENAAFNPSLEPVQCAVALAVLSGVNLEEIASIEVVQRSGGPVDHLAYARLIAAAIGEDITVAGTEIAG